MELIQYTRRARCVVALSDPSDLIQRVARYLGHLLRRRALGKKPEDLPLAPFNGIFGVAIPLFQLGEREMFYEF